MDCKELLRLADTWEKEVCFFGAGYWGATWCYDIAICLGLKVDFYCDNKKEGQICNNLKVYSATYLNDKKDVLCIITVTGNAIGEIKKQLDQIGVKNIFIMCDENPIIELAQFVEDSSDNKLKRKLASVLDDETYIMRQFEYHMGYRFDIEKPSTFNEKLQWLKLHDRNPKYTNLVDKYEVKKIIAGLIGEKYIIPTLGVWDSFDAIDFDELPDKFVLKCTHDSGSVYVVDSKRTFDYEQAKKMISYALKHNYYWHGREWPYKNVKPRIIAERNLATNKGEGIKDYKLMVFNGEVKCSFVCTDRCSKDGLKVTFFDRQWKKMPFRRHYPTSEERIERPQNYEKMVELAELLSEDIPFVRVDFYEVAGELFFGEMTFYPGNGMEEFTPEIWDKKIGDMLDLKGVMLLD